MFTAGRASRTLTFRDVMEDAVLAVNPFDLLRVTDKGMDLSRIEAKDIMTPDVSACLWRKAGNLSA